MSSNLSNDEDEILGIGEHLLSILEDIQSTGSFLTGENKATAIDPGLFIPSLGTIGLPISPDNTRAIIQLCDMSPYGKGTETLVNHLVRKTWQLDANQFSFQNPDWNRQLAIFVDQAVSGLGLQANALEVKAEPYKLLIYEEGAFFSAHQDSEKADGMFGTLIRVEFSTAEVFGFGFSWAAWYADVTHEVKPVTSGHRVVLVYSLIHRPTASLLKVGANKTKRLTDCLDLWSRTAEARIERSSNIYGGGWEIDYDAGCPPALVYTFEHKYTTAELGFDRLKGVDQSRFAELHITDVETTLNLVRVIDRVGATVVTDLPFPEDMLLPVGVLDRSPDDEDYEGYTGNEGASASHFYTETGALIIPKVFSFSFELQQLITSRISFPETLGKYRKALSECPSDVLTRQRLLKVCRLLSECHYASESLDKTQDEIMQLDFELGDLDLLSCGMSIRNRKVSPLGTVLVARTIVQHGLDAIRLPQQNQQPSGEVLEWENGKFDHILSANIGNSAPSGRRLALELNDLLTHVSLERISSFLETRLENTPFVLWFIEGSHTSLFRENTSADSDEIVSFYNGLLPKFAHHFTIEHTLNKRGIPTVPGGPSLDASASTPIFRIMPDMVIKLIHVATNTHSNISEIMGTLTRYAIDAKTRKGIEDAFHRFLFPVARGICHQIEATKRPSTADEKRFITTLLSSYLTDYVKDRPLPPPPDWKARTTLECSPFCLCCIPVRRFINSTQQSKSFVMSEEYIEHVDMKLDKGYFRTKAFQEGSHQKLYIEKTEQAMAILNMGP
ncbi:uncharacterized protein TRUGW13939_07418 [Talaromyces rugulosus]|uniref:Prolyl 4-hydroxylase alpha subunit Fe(2+) 2OG dioxygenase domain-containing protein n=1 Tax=Talaromyces rugulosus TaxID=121627 RepID=A0A7H8R3P7_TALRU|nr:uncharacterized protein TRUGW13939_07418 [Talaromyces rugulosus]QKX60275.1 hypothetical protein TRUGW13939_07418 [Talaromyces rugulosus]